MAGNFIVNEEITLTSTNETNVLYVLNPSANTKQLYNISLTGTSLDTSVALTFRVYSNPTVSSNGTSVTPVSRNFVDGNTSSMNVYSSPTVTSKGTKISTFSVVTSGSFELDTSSWYLFHGNSFLITIQAATSNKGAALNMSWSE